ncbi:alpha-fucosidase A [Tirmania nivea]|nr:alpha-fucosidase A [Tirmania nivea]
MGNFGRQFLAVASAVSSVEAKRLMYKQPAEFWAEGALVIGNGRLGASVFGGIQKDVWHLNIDSLWVGGPFQNETCNGVNPSKSKYAQYQAIQEAIFNSANSTGVPFLKFDKNYGSFTQLGNLTIELDFATGIESKDYELFPDLETGVASCVYYINSTKPLPPISIGLEAIGCDPKPTHNSLGNSIIQMRGLAEAPYGMTYDSRVAPPDGKFLVPASVNVSELYLLFAGNTNYDETMGNTEAGYTFPLRIPFDKLLSGHVSNHSALMNEFKLTVPDPLNSYFKSTDELVKEYNITKGEPYLESLIFDFGRYLLIGSSRENSMPPNLQSIWSNGFWAPWSGDYHVNINLQMNVWGSEATGLGRLLPGLWSYMRETWVPRGSETAKLLYSAEEGWVIHNELNIFGSTGVKGGDTGGDHWHFYHSSNAWMMQHVWDHYDYTRDAKWWWEVGYPLLKGVAQFQMHMLVEDAYTKDGSLVVGVCNSPEQHPTTFGCSINQQQIWEDLAFKKRVEATLAKMDKGIHIGRYGQIRNGRETLTIQLTNTGIYPISTDGTLRVAISGAHKDNTTIESAVATTLTHRGPGNWKDANAGWAKPGDGWYWILKYALQENFTPNLFSLYTKGSGIFQIDANFGWVGAVLEKLSKDLDQTVERFKAGKGEREVLLGAAVPESWLPMKVEGLRLRGGGEVSFAVAKGGLVCAIKVSGRPKGKGGIIFVHKKERVVGKT